MDNMSHRIVFMLSVMILLTQRVCVRPPLPALPRDDTSKVTPPTSFFSVMDFY